MSMLCLHKHDFQFQMLHHAFDGTGTEAAIVVIKNFTTTRKVGRLSRRWAKCIWTNCPMSHIALHRLGLNLLFTYLLTYLLTCYADRSFLVNGFAVWNGLPVGLRSPGTLLDTFNDKLKTFLFRTVY